MGCGAQLLLGGPGGIDLLEAPYAAEVGTDFGMYQAVTTTTASLFTDGSVVTGEFSDNRTIKLRVMVEAPRPGWRSYLVAACEALFVAVNQPTNELWFVPDDGPTVVYEVFRGQPERVDDQSEAWLRREYVFTFSAKPFTRSAEAVSTGALSPSITLADFESATTGFLAATGVRPSPGPGSEFGMPYDTTLAESSWVQVARPPALTADANCTVVNGTTVSTPRSPTTACSTVTVTASGMAEAHVTATGATSAAGVTAGINIYWTGGTRYAQAGVEWSDAAGTVLGVEWSAPQVLRETGQPYGGASFEGGTVWVSGTRPSTATKARLRVRFPNATAGAAYPILGAAIVPLTSGTIPTSTSTSHDGSASAHLAVAALDPQVLTSGYIHPANPQGAGYLKVALAAPVDVSAKPLIQVWFYVGASGTPIRDVTSVRLSDATGKWSRYDAYTAGDVGSDGWQNLAWALATPAQTSTAGPVDRSAVTSVSLSMIREWNGMDVYVDGIQAVDQPTATNSLRGTVYTLDILGSAPSTVATQISSSIAMTDVLLAAADPAIAVMVRVTSSVGTVPAPAAHNGTYRIIGALSPATNRTTPTCLVNQFINGVSVATQTLTGTMQTGNHYCDFGAVSLPLTAVPTDNQNVSYTFTLAPSSTAWSEVLVLDVDRPLAWIPNMDTAHAFVWVDEPEGTAQLGRVWVGSAGDRSDARSPAAPPDLSKPFQVKSPSTSVLVYSTSGAPNIEELYFPRHLVEPPE